MKKNMSTSDVIAVLASIKKILKKEISTKNCDTKCAACRLFLINGIAKAIAFCPWVQKNSYEKPFGVSSIHPSIHPSLPPPPLPTGLQEKTEIRRNIFLSEGQLLMQILD